MHLWFFHRQKHYKMINISNLEFSYQKDKKLFKNFNCQFNQGSIIGLLGKNGVGKTTLLKLISGLIFPKKGSTIQVNGFVPTERKPDFLSDVYYIPEEFSFPNVTVGKFVKALAPLYPNFDYEKLNRIFQEFELNMTDELNGISHGQRKKFLIGFALSTNCKLLLLDEPTNGLDIPSKSLFRKVLVSSVTEEQAVIISTHQVHDVESIIDQIVIMDKGKIVFDQSVDEVTAAYEFNVVSSLDEADRTIYSEKASLGYKIIQSDATTETALDLELLFNAVINGKIQK